MRPNLLIAAAAVVLLPARIALGAWGWDLDRPGVRELKPGLRYQHQSGTFPGVAGPQDVHVVRVDLRSPNVAVRVNREADRGLTTSDFGRRYGGVLVAINGGLRENVPAPPQQYRPKGLAIAEHKIWSDDSGAGFVAFGADNQADIQRDEDTKLRRDDVPTWFHQAVNTNPTLAWGGKPEALKAYCDMAGDYMCGENARTVVGLSKDGRYLFLVVMDEGRAGAKGMTMYDLAQFMASELDADRAANLDGGGSSTMWVKGEGVKNRPGDGQERHLVTHLGVVYADPCLASVRGYVRADRADAGSGINGARVRFAGDNRIHATQNGGPDKRDGYFEFRGLACGAPVATAEKTGYVTTTRRAYLTPKIWSDLVVQLEPGMGALREDAARTDPTGFDDSEPLIPPDEDRAAGELGAVEDLPQAMGCSATGAAPSSLPSLLLLLVLARLRLRKKLPALGSP